MHKVRNYLSLLAAGSALLPTVAFGLYAFETGELFVTAEPHLEYDSNIYGNASELSDWHARVPVGVLVIRDAGHIRAEGTAGVDFGFFETYSEEDFADPYARASFRYDRAGHPLVADARLGWWRQSSSDPLVEGRTEVERAQVVLDGRYRTHRRLSWRGGTNYQYWDYARGFLSERNQWGVRAGAEYSYSPRLDVGLNYAYTRTDSDRGDFENIRSTDHTVFVSASGQITPRITQTIELGAKRRSFDDSVMESSTEPYASASLLWDVDELTQFRLTAVSDFAFSPENASISEYRFELEYRRRIDAKIVLTAAAHYGELDFTYLDRADRTDDEVGGRVGIEYTFTELTSARLQGSYLTRSSSSAFADYDRYVIGGTLRFQF